MAVALPLSQRCRNRLASASAYATATPRAPDGTQSPYRCRRSRFDCALPPLSKRQFNASHRAAACTEAPRRRAGCGPEPAPSRLRVPCHGPAWPGCLGIARCTLVPDFLCERRNENAPGVESEGIRRASEDRGDRSPGKGVDQGWWRSPSYANRAHGPASRFGSDGVGRVAMGFGINMVEVLFNSKERVAHVCNGRGDYSRGCVYASEMYASRRAVMFDDRAACMRILVRPWQHSAAKGIAGINRPA